MRAGFMVLFFLFLLPAAITGQRSPESAPLVKIAAGSLRGQLRDGTAIFQGIPYAAPPIGALRWREPQPVIAWGGVRDAAKPAAACYQDAAGLTPFIAPPAATYGARFQGHPVISSEDCLYLNLWAPAWSAKSALPVMVWLHGGSNTAGSGSQPTYDGASLAAHGVILVTINYRLGILGFFSHPELTRESVHHSSGNYGILDQLAALRWVRENIAQFGGDPKNVTLFGESAGSIDAGMLLASPLSTGLFRRVILESGPPFGLGRPHTLAEAEAFGSAIGNVAGGRSSSSFEDLRALKPDDLTQIVKKVLETQFKGYDAAGPIVDGWLLPQAPSHIFADGSMQKVNLMVGVNGRELSAFRAMAAAQPKAAGKPDRGTAGQAVAKLAETVRPIYGAWTDPAIAIYLAKALANRDLAIDQASNDMLLACPVGALSALMTSAGEHAYVYRFDRSIPGPGEAALGAFHGLEVPYVFNAFGDSSWRWLPFTGSDRQLSSIIETYWTNFAKTGNPNSTGLPGWPAWNTEDEPYMQFDQSANATPRKGFSPTFCHLSPDRLKRQLATQ